MAFWEDRLSGFSAPSSIRECKSASLSPVGQRRTFRLSGVLNHAIKSFCDEYRVAPFSVLYMALAIYLRRTGGRDNIAIGVPVLNRVNFSEKQSTGMFVSTLPFIGRIDESWTLKQFNEEGVEKLVSVLGDNVEDLAERLTATVEVSRNYRSFSGLTDGMDGAVRFIYRTEAVEKAE